MSKAKVREHQVSEVVSGELFRYRGRWFLFEIKRDEHMGEPWVVHDGHGVIHIGPPHPHNGDNDYTLLGCGYWWDTKASYARAVEEGWGVGDTELKAMAQTLGRAPTPQEITERACELDLERMRDWINDVWWWVGVVVTLVVKHQDAEDGYFKTKYRESLWGIEADAGSYFAEVAKELAEQLIESKGARA